MRKPTFVILIISVLSISLLAQSTYKDADRIKKKLKLPSSTSLIFSDSEKLKDIDPIKAYIETDGTKSSEKRFTKWIEKWNKEEAQKYGEIEIVSKISDADVVFCRFIVREVPYRKTTINFGDRIKPSNDQNTRANLYIPRPQYSYLVLKKPENLVVVYSNKNESDLRDDPHPDKNLFEALTRRMKSK